jgi:predicted nucleic acid-binding protein
VIFFVDANAILYSAVEGEARANCHRVLKAIAAGEVEGRTSPAVLEEVWHVSMRSFGGALNDLVGKALAVFYPLLPVTEAALAHALSMPDSELGAKDRLHVGTCATHEIDTVLSADRAFDGIAGIRRVDPFDDAAVVELLATA